MPVLFLFVVIVVLFCFLAWYNSARQKGKRGEKLVSQVLSQLPEEYVILNDVVLPTTNGTTQIDHIVVSRYGVFTIETKNYRGDIYGDDNRQEWTQLIVTEVTYTKKWWKTYTYVTKSHFYNPVKQSVGHALRIQERLKEFPQIKVVPIVVFTGAATLENVNSSHYVVYIEQLLSAINNYKSAFLTDNDVQRIVNILQQNNVREQVKDSQHVKNVYAARRKVDNVIAAGRCPKCGGQLVQRKGRYGSFYGCSNYPNCKFTTQ